MISVDELHRAAKAILESLGETPENAEKAARCLVKADMRGIPTHGTYLLKTMAERVAAGQLALPTRPRVVSDREATAVLDGMNGLGMAAGMAAMALALAKSRQYGVAMVLVRNTNNVGSLSCYTQLAARQDAIAIMACNAAPAMAPWGGAEPYMGTNPISIAFPAQGAGFTADMATSVAARGKIRQAARRGTAIPSHWALDSRGAPTTDPHQALEGTLLPIGGPKGSALAMAVDIVSGLLAGSAFGPAVRSFHSLEGATGVGVCCIAIDLSRFMAPEAFRQAMDRYAAAVKGVKKADGFDAILMPGEIESQNEQRSLREGIPMDPQTVAALNGLLQQAGIAMTLRS